MGFARRASTYDASIIGPPFSLGRSTQSAATISWNTFRSWSLPGNAAAVTNVSANWSKIGKRDFVTGSIDLR